MNKSKMGVIVMRNRTVTWMEGKILRVLTKKPIITTYLALSSLVLRDVRSTDEQTNLDVAVEHLLSKKVIRRFKDNDGFTVFSLAA